jgi:predicted O-methyltransferase YrrM
MGPPGEDTQGAWAPWQSPAPIAANEKEKVILDALADMYANQRRGTMNVQPEEGRTLRLLTEALGAKNVVEIGTSNGYSGIWFCLALQATGGKLTTHDIDEGRAAMARENFKKAGVDQIVTLVMGDAHETVKNLKEPIDILFIDADKEGYVDYLNKLLPLVRPGGLILAHNVHISGGQAPEYVKAITTNPALETNFIHQQGGGVSVTLKKRQAK